MKNKSRKPLHLLIDGTDRVGKTTVCELLRLSTGLPVIKMKDMSTHFSSEPEKASEIFNKTIVQLKKYSFICDRGFPSSIVYSKIYKRKYDLSYLEDIQKELNPVVIILVSYADRGKDEIIEEKKRLELQEEYIRQSNANGWNMIDVTNLTPSQTLSEIRRVIKFPNNNE